ncbi:MAG: nuclear transport factor 2 family protein [Gammaproteobacteria bacterium]|nr:nuclear transport factor 2 family protein [Gammaproteobacteria bacterium]
MKRLLALLSIFLPMASAGAEPLGPNELASRLAIQELIAEYAFRWDSKRSADFVELFTEDAVMERRLDGETVAGSRLQGKQAILDYAVESHNGRLADRQSRHHMSGIRFLEISENVAITENLVLITHQTADDSFPVNRSSGIYRISWRLTPEGWKMSQRILITDRFGN